MEIKKISVQNVFRNTFQVPKYQRKFVWGPSEIEELIKDTNDAAKDNSSNFLGNIVVRKISRGTEIESNLYDIIDGQQRITAITFIIRYLLIFLEENNQGNGAQYFNIQRLIWYQKEAESYDSEPEWIPRLKPSESIKELYKKIFTTNWRYDDYPGSPFLLKVKKVKPIMQKIKLEIDNLYNGSNGRQSLNKFINALCASTFSFIEVDSDSEAMDIFERINTRGMDLGVSDLLKNYIYKNIEDIDESTFEVSWEKIDENCGKKDSNMAKMLKYFCISKFGADGKVGNKGLFKLIKKYINKETLDKFMQEVCLFSEFYFICSQKDSSINYARIFFENLGFKDGCPLDENELKHLCTQWNLLTQIGIKQHIPLLYSVLKYSAEAAQSANPRTFSKTKKRLRAVFRSLASYHYINNGILTNPTNIVEKKYCEYAEKFSNTEFANSELIVELVRSIDEIKFGTSPSEINIIKNQFKDEFTKLSYSKNDNYKIDYFFHFYYNEAMSNAGEGTDRHRQAVHFIVYDYYMEKIDRTHSIEHIASQTEQEGELTIDEDLKNSIGNLMSLNRSINQSLNNKPVDQKIHLLCETNNFGRIPDASRILKDFYDQNGGVWDGELIHRRGEELANIAADIMIQSSL